MNAVTQSCGNSTSSALARLHRLVGASLAQWQIDGAKVCFCSEAECVEVRMHGTVAYVIERAAQRRQGEASAYERWHLSDASSAKVQRLSSLISVLRELRLLLDSGFAPGKAIIGSRSEAS
ncbi:MAG: hypothetical protein HOI95_15320 [Chromatiales bacterium]|nr:hypothetical protein [Chromatiales bacterium]